MSEMTYKVLYNMLMEHEGVRMRKLKALELPEYRHIPWVKDFSCPQCGKDEWSHEGWRARPIGWCDTPEGYMGIFECPECFAKMRWHISTAGRWNKEMFLTDLWAAVMVGNRELLDDAC